MITNGLIASRVLKITQKTKIHSNDQVVANRFFAVVLESLSQIHFSLYIFCKSLQGYAMYSCSSHIDSSVSTVPFKNSK